jgi:hypothetical protein
MVAAAATVMACEIVMNNPSGKASKPFQHE